MAKEGRTYVTQSISFAPDMLARAKERAENLGLPFSAYVQKCLEKDLAERGAIIFTERIEEPVLAVAEDQAPLKPVAASIRKKR